MKNSQAFIERSMPQQGNFRREANDTERKTDRQTEERQYTTTLI